MSRFLLLAALLGASVLGGGLGFLARRARDRVHLPPRRVRSAPLERAWRIWEAGEGSRLARGGAPSPREPSAREASDPEDEAEWALLRALSVGAPGGIEAVARRWPRSAAAAVAAWTLIERSKDAVEREARREAFRRVWPRAWILRRGAERPR